MSAKKFIPKTVKLLQDLVNEAETAYFISLREGAEWQDKGKFIQRWCEKFRRNNQKVVIFNEKNDISLDSVINKIRRENIKEENKILSRIAFRKKQKKYKKLGMGKLTAKQMSIIESNN
jgi:hypothetical protein